MTRVQSLTVAIISWQALRSTQPPNRCYGPVSTDVKLQEHEMTNSVLGEISGCYGGKFEDDCLLGCCAVLSCRNWLMFQRCLPDYKAQHSRIQSSVLSLLRFCVGTDCILPMFRKVKIYLHKLNVILLAWFVISQTVSEVSRYRLINWGFNSQDELDVPLGHHVQTETPSSMYWGCIK